MANENKDEKRPVGRPKGRQFTHHFRVPMTPEMREELLATAMAESKSAAGIVRDLIERYLRRHRSD